MTNRSPRILVTASLILLPLLLFSPQLIGASSFDQDGASATLSTYRRVAFDILRSGHLPLWNPYASGGGPLLGDGRVALLYPIAWLSFIVDPIRANTLFAVLNFVVAAIGSILFARRLRMSEIGVAVTTIGFTLSGSLVARVGQPTTMAAAALVPLLFWGAERLLQRASAKHVITLALLAAVQVFSGDLVVVMCTSVALLLYAAGRASRPRDVANVFSALLLGASLSAVQLAPWIAALFDTLTLRSDYGQHFFPANPVGFAAAALAIFGIVTSWNAKRDARVAAVALVGAAILIGAFGWRSASVFALLTSVLAGTGAQKSLKFGRFVPHAVAAVVLIEMGLIALLATQSEGSGPPLNLSATHDFLIQQPAPFRAAYFGNDGVAVSLERNHIELIGPAAPLLSKRAAALLPEDDLSILPRAGENPWSLFNAKFAIVKKNSGWEAKNSWPLVFDDRDVFVLRNPTTFGHGYFPKQVVTDLPDDVMLGIVRSNVPANRIAVVEGLAEPYAQLVTIVGDNDAKLIRRSPTEVTFVSPRVSYAPYDPPASVSFASSASPNALSFETTTDRPRMLVLSEIDSPGWRLEEIGADGSIDPSPIYRANYAFRGMLVGQGTSKFRMLYRPSAFYLGALVTALCAIGCTTTWLAPMRPRLASRLSASLASARQCFSESFDRLADSRDWLSTVCLALTAIALGIAIQLRDGQYSTGAIALLSCACGFTIAATRVPKLDLVSGNRWRPDILALALAMPLFFALTLGTLPNSDRAFPICVGLAALVAGMALSGHSPLGRWTLPLILVAHLGAGIAAIHAARLPTIDVYLFQHDAAEALLRGQNPYAVTNRNMYGQGTFLYAAQVQQGGRLLFGYPYMPLTLYFTTAAQFLFDDYRYGQALAITLAGALIAYARPSRIGLLATILFLFAPQTFYVITQGWTEPFQLLLLALTVFCAIRVPRIMPIALGLLLVSKQYMIVAVLVVPLLARTRSSRAIWSILWPAALTGAVVTLPLVLINFGAFWRSAGSLQFKQPFRLDALSFLVTMSDVKFDAAMRASGTPVRGAVAFGIVGLLVGAALAWWKARPSPRAFLVGVTLMLLLFFAFNKQAFANYYFFVVGAALMATAVGSSSEAGEKGEKGEVELDAR